jgi:DNA-binding GntR family transcriptional regulator
MGLRSRYQMLALGFRSEVAAEEHRALLDAALARDAEHAAAVLETHINGGVAHALSKATL